MNNRQRKAALRDREEKLIRLYAEMGEHPPICDDKDDDSNIGCAALFLAVTISWAIIATVTVIALTIYH